MACCNSGSQGSEPKTLTKHLQRVANRCTLSSLLQDRSCQELGYSRKPGCVRFSYIMHSQMAPTFVESLMYLFGENLQVHVTLQALLLIAQNRVDVNVIHENVALTACSRHSAWNLALHRLHCVGVRQVLPNLVSYNTVIRNFQASGSAKVFSTLSQSS